MDIDDRLINTKDAAALLGFGVHTLEEWRRLGKGPEYVRISERTVRYNLKKLKEWIADNTVKAEAPDA